MATNPPSDPHLSTSTSQPPSDAESLTPLEQEVLDEYARLLGNMNEVRLSPPSPIPLLFLHLSPSFSSFKCTKLTSP